jgi:replicative DNA helicase
MTTVAEDPLPNDVEAEAAVLGSLLIDPEFAWGKVGSLITAEDFYAERHKVLYQIVATMMMEGVTPDLITLPERLEEQGHLEEMGGAAGLTRLIERTPTSLNVHSYAEIVSKLSQVRQVYHDALAVAHKALEPGVKADDLRYDLLQAAVAKRKTNGVYTLSEALGIAEQAQRDLAAGIEPPGADPILHSLRDALKHGKLWPGSVVIVTGDSGTGKSMLGLQLDVLNVLLGLRVAYIGAELPVGFVADRIVPMLANICEDGSLPVRIRERLPPELAGIPITNETMRNGQAEGLISLLTEAVEQALDERQMIIIDDAQDVNQIILHLETESVRAGPFDLVVVDYLQLIGDESGDARSETEQMNRISDIFRRYCIDTNTILVGIASLRKSNDPEPKKDDVRSSKRLTYAASVVLALWQDPDVIATNWNGLKMKVLKNSRYGTIGNTMEGQSFPVAIDPKTGLFSEVDLTRTDPHL